MSSYSPAFIAQPPPQGRLGSGTNRTEGDPRSRPASGDNSTDTEGRVLHYSSCTTYRVKELQATGLPEMDSQVTACLTDWVTASITLSHCLTLTLTYSLSACL